MLIKIIKTHRDIVSICDTELLGKKFQEENFQLEIKENFYKGDEKNKQEIIEIIEKMVLEDATFNIVGEESIKTAIESEIISENDVKKIKNIPYALILS